MHNSPILEKQSGSSIQVAFNLINTSYSQLNSGEWVAAVLNHSDYKPKIITSGQMKSARKLIKYIK
ncbi:hypothetical protein [Leuconostoc fallax]|uniref:hypothetical protein n=1 Tax=Leuconostoc fallax TaxID=1251 RepID=UPI00020D99B6|nr:hypothetical protein [Leuconostoc fallax]